MLRNSSSERRRVLRKSEASLWDWQPPTSADGYPNNSRQDPNSAVQHCLRLAMLGSRSLVGMTNRKRSALHQPTAANNRILTTPRALYFNVFLKSAFSSCSNVTARRDHSCHLCGLFSNILIFELGSSICNPSNTSLDTLSFSLF